MILRMKRLDNLRVHGLQMAKYRSTDIADKVRTDTVTEVVWKSKQKRDK